MNIKYETRDGIFYKGELTADCITLKTGDTRYVRLKNNPPSILTPITSTVVMVGDPSVSLSAIITDEENDINTYTIEINSGSGSLTGDISGSFSNGRHDANFNFIIPVEGGTSVIRVTSTDSMGEITTKDITISIDDAPPPPPPPAG